MALQGDIMKPQGLPNPKSPSACTITREVDLPLLQAIVSQRDLNSLGEPLREPTACGGSASPLTRPLRNWVVHNQVG